MFAITLAIKYRHLVHGPMSSSGVFQLGVYVRLATPPFFEVVHSKNSVQLFCILSMFCFFLTHSLYMLSLVILHAFHQFTPYIIVMCFYYTIGISLSGQECKVR